MRHPIALYAALTLACEPVAQRSEVKTFDPARDSDLLVCEPRLVDFEPASGIERVTAASDSSLLLLYADAREVLVVDGALSPLRALQLESEGPTGVVALQDAISLGDSLFVVAEGPRRHLRAFTADGDPAWVLPLPAVPDRILPTPVGIVVFPLHLAGVPSSGPYLVRNGAVDDLAIAPEPILDPQMRTLANLVSPTLALGTSRMIAPRQFIAPVASVIELGGRSEPAQVPMPIATATAHQAWWTPRPPYRADEMEQIITPAMSATGGPHAGEISVLTRTGHDRGEHLEKVIVRLDHELDVMSAMTVPFNAMHLAWLPSEQAYYVVTADDRWHRCELPAPDSLLEVP